MTQKEQAARKQMQEALRKYLTAHNVLCHAWEELENETNIAEFAPYPIEKHFPYGNLTLYELNVEKWVNTSIDTLNRPFVDAPTIGLDNDETTIASIETQQTGGHVYNDVVTLKDGIVIRISEGGLTVYKNAAADDDNNEHGFIEFPDTTK